jgi:hypothetical protein
MIAVARNMKPSFCVRVGVSRIIPRMMTDRMNTPRKIRLSLTNSLNMMVLHSGDIYMGIVPPYIQPYSLNIQA